MGYKVEMDTSLSTSISDAISNIQRSESEISSTITSHIVASLMILQTLLLVYLAYLRHTTFDANKPLSYYFDYAGRKKRIPLESEVWKPCRI